MKTGFPHKNWFGRPQGWKDLGNVGADYKSDGVETTSCHAFCRTRLRVGKENEKRFLYCPKCQVILEVLAVKKQ